MSSANFMFNLRYELNRMDSFFPKCSKGLFSVNQVEYPQFVNWYFLYSVLITVILELLCQLHIEQTNAKYVYVMQHSENHLLYRVYVSCLYDLTNVMALMFTAASHYFLSS